MVQWAMELSQFDIDHQPRMAIKAQALVDFVTEFTMADQDLEADYLTVYIDKSSASRIGEVRVILLSPENGVLKYGVKLQFPKTNNDA